MTPLTLCRQDTLGAIRVTGSDARTFLHAQLTQNIRDLAPNRHTLAGWLSAQGRVRALFDVVPSADAFVLVTAIDNIEPTLRQLGMFVLRADVGLKAADDIAVHALVGDSASWLADRGLSLTDDVVVEKEGLLWLRAGPRLVQTLGASDRVGALFAGIERGEATLAELETIMLGLPAIPAMLRERYVPQMLNLEQLGAVAFDKGCYPGQEIVARTQHRGTVKRRLRRFSAGPGPAPAPGAAIIDDSGTAVGEVNRSAPTASGHALLAVIQLDSLDRLLRLADDARTLAMEPPAKA